MNKERLSGLKSFSKQIFKIYKNLRDTIAMIRINSVNDQ